MKCDNCEVEECETREVLKKYPKETELHKIILRNCNQFEYKKNKKLT